MKILRQPRPGLSRALGLLASALALASPLGATRMLIDFGSDTTGYLTASPTWNNVTSPALNTSLALKDTSGLSTGVTLTITAPFNVNGANSANLDGTIAPAGNATGFPSTATRDSFFGNTQAFNGQTNVSPKVTLTGLDPAQTYSLAFFASRTGVSDVRTTRYTVVGAQTVATELDASNNVSEVAGISRVSPTASGTLAIELSPGTETANTSSHAFTYLGALEIRTGAPSLLAQWTFDEPASGSTPVTTVADSSTGAHPLDLFKGTTPVDLHFPGSPHHATTGNGVSNFAGDRGAIFNAATTVGPAGINATARAVNPQASPRWQNLSEFTVTAWMKTGTLPISNAHLLHWDGAEPVFLHFPNGTNAHLALKIGSTSPTTYTANDFFASNGSDNGDWVFLAVTYKAHQTSGGVAVYRGTKAAEAVSLALTGPGNTTGPGVIRNLGPGDLFLGNNANRDRAFPGCLDDVRVYDAALSKDEIDAVRRAALRAEKGLPLAHWRFDEDISADGSEPKKYAYDDSTRFNPLILKFGGADTDLHSGAGTGVSAQTYDRALAINGAVSNLGRLPAPQALPLWRDLRNLTVTAWVKATAVPTASKRLLHWAGDEPIDFWFPDAGKTAFTVGGVNHQTTASLVDAPNVWRFVAVTYQAGKATDGVKFYRGTTADDSIVDIPLAAGSGDTRATGIIQNLGPGDLAVGNLGGFGRAFPGLIDDVRIYEGALSPQRLELIRASGLAPKQLLLNAGLEQRQAPTNIADAWSVHHVGGPGYAFSVGTSRTGAPTGSVSQQIAFTNLLQQPPPGTPARVAMVKQNVRFEGGQTYVARIWARATTGNCNARFYLRGAGAPYTTYAIHTLWLTANWQEFVISGGNGGDDEVYFAFEVLDPGNHTIQIDSASLQKIDEATDAPLSVGKTIPAEFFGIHLLKRDFHNIWPAMGQGTLRLWDTTTRWGNIQKTTNPDPSTWTWGTFEKMRNLPHAHLGANTKIIYTAGMPHVSLVPGGTVYEYDANISVSPPPDTAAGNQAWRNYLVAVYNRGKINGIPTVRHWEMWNEVNNGDGGGETRFYHGDVERLVTLTAEAKSALKAVDTTNQILSPNTTSSGLPTFERFLEKGGRHHIDIHSIHSYTGLNPERNRAYFRAVKSIVDRYTDVPVKPIWNTEGAAWIGNGFPTDAVAHQERAGVVCRSYVTQAVYGISHYGWYSWDHGNDIRLANLIPGPQEGVNWSAVSALAPDAQLSVAGKAYQQTVQWLKGATVVNYTVTESQTMGERWVVALTRPTGGYKAWIVWDSGGSRNWAYPGTWGIQLVRKLDGSTATPPGSSTVSIGRTPILLQNTTAIPAP